MDLKELVGELTAERLALEGYTQLMAEDRAKLNATPEAAQLAGALLVVSESKDRVKELEAQVRSMAGMMHMETGSKKPAPGIGIRVSTALVYDPAEAKAWCVDTFPKGLNLNKREFEKAAKVLQPEFVSYKQAFTATIAKDLPGALAKAAKEAQDEEG